MRRGNSPRKLTVEECAASDIGELAQKGIFETRGIHELGLTGFCAPTPLKMPFVVERLGEDTERIFFRFRVRNGPFEPGKEVRYAIEIVSEPCRFGGKRRWLRCPLLRDGIACQKQTLKLFLPAGGLYFGCRACYGLTYRSVQEHDRRVDELARLDVDELAAALRSLPGRHAFLGLRAIQKKRERVLRKWKSTRYREFLTSLT